MVGTPGDGPEGFKCSMWGRGASLWVVGALGSMDRIPSLRIVASDHRATSLPVVCRTRLSPRAYRGDESACVPGAHEAAIMVNFLLPGAATTGQKPAVLARKERAAARERGSPF